MKRTKLQRLTALLMAVVFLICGGAVVSVSAEESSSGSHSTTDVTTDDIRALLNAMTYEDYMAKYFYDAETNPNGYHRATGDPIVIDAIQAYDENQSDAKVEIVTQDGVQGLLTPGDGKVTWVTDKVTSAALYSIMVEYYAVADNKPASIERIFSINGAIPFAEARYLTLQKTWKNAYQNAIYTLSKKETDADGAKYVSDAAAAGLKATYDASSRTVSYEMPQYWTTAAAKIAEDLSLRFFLNDVDRNEIRPTTSEDPGWRTCELKEANGFYTETFEFLIEPDEDGKVTLSFDGVNESMIIKSITLFPHEDLISYEEYLESLGDKQNVMGSDKIKYEAEHNSSISSTSIYPVNDRSCAVNSPADSDRTVLNTIGGDKWATAGQWASYTFSISSSGMYDIALRFRQNSLDGMYVSRAMNIYACYEDASGNLVRYTEEEYRAKFGNTAGFYDGIPFEEAASIQFGYDTNWQSSLLTTDSANHSNSYAIYFESGVVYNLEFEVTLGAMGSIVRTVQASLESINDDYLNILKLTGASPDAYRDYGFYRVMPDTVIDMAIQSDVLYDVAAALSSTAGVKSSMSATLEKVAWLLDRMTDEDNIASNLSQLKSYIGTLGTWLGSAKTQPLELDYIVVQPVGSKLPVAKPNFWQSLVHEVSSFFQSFIRNYNRMGATEETSDEATEVWLAYGRDQSQVIRNLINNDFTPNPNYRDKNGDEIAVDLKLVAGGTLLPSILSHAGPDVYIGLGQSDVINYAIRGALISIEEMEGFNEMCGIDAEGNYVGGEHAQFNKAAMMVLGIKNAKDEMHYYGLPETQGFDMMFIREDVLAELNIEIPKTWDDVLAAVPTLQANNMAIGMGTDYQLFLYQMGGELFADGGMRINLDSNVALKSFEKMCNMFTMYGFPYKYDFANRFRTGEMPIGFAGYTGTYNHLKVFATEIEGLWGFYPLPGILDEETGEINNVAVSSCSAIVMITGCENEYNAWQFMKWHVGADCQAAYSNEMVAIIGPSAKHSTANLEALESMPWTTEEYLQLQLQFNNLASIPNYPGYYIIGRYTKFAFLKAYNDKDDPVEALQSYITTINKEITRKREEFDLETLDYIGQTLAEKRIGQAIDLLEELRNSASWNQSYDSLVQKASKILDKKTEDYASIAALSSEFKAANADFFQKLTRYMDDAANALAEYENYK